jgi:hypothetical protein
VDILNIVKKLVQLATELLVQFVLQKYPTPSLKPSARSGVYTFAVW